MLVYQRVILVTLVFCTKTLACQGLNSWLITIQHTFRENPWESGWGLHFATTKESWLLHHKWPNDIMKLWLCSRSWPNRLPPYIGCKRDKRALNGSEMIIHRGKKWECWGQVNTISIIGFQWGLESPFVQLVSEMTIDQLHHHLPVFFMVKPSRAPENVA